MKLDVQEHDNGIIEIRMEGRLDIAGVGSIETPFSAYTNRDNGLVLLNMNGVEFMSSIGVRLLLVSAKALEQRAGKMALLVTQQGVYKVLEMSGVLTLIPTFDNREDAVDSLLAAA